MPDLLDFIPLFPEETEAAIRARWDSWANEGLGPTDPNRVDTREGSIFYVLTQPGVREAARWYDRAGTEVVSASNPVLAFGTYLDYHAATIRLSRNPAFLATGEVTFTGTNGAQIPSGTQVEVEADSPDQVPPSFQTTAPGVISGTTVTVPVQATGAGRYYNVPVGAVTVIAVNVPGVDSVTNADAIGGGSDPESDEDLRRRIINSYSGLAPGNKVFYERIAGEYPGVGRVTVIPLYKGPGTVLVIVTDADGSPVSNAVVTGLQNLLDPVTFATTLTAPATAGDTTLTVASTAGSYVEPGFLEIEDDVVRYAGKTATTFTGCTNVDSNHVNGTPVYQRQGGDLAAVGAYVRVVTASLLLVDVAATIEFEDGYSLDGAAGTVALRDVIESEIRRYVDTRPPGSVVHYYKVLGAIVEVEGVADVSAVTVNGGTSNITTTTTPAQVPRLDTLTLTAA